MTKTDRPAWLYLLACLSLGLTASCWVRGDRVLAQSLIEPSVVAQTVVIDGVSVQTGSGFSFTYTDPRVVPNYPNYPIGGFRFRSTPRQTVINSSTLINPTIVNSPIRNSTLINPTIVNSPSYNPGNSPSYQPYPYLPYPYSIQTIQTINRPSPEIVVDPQYGVRFKNPPGY